MIWFVVGVIYLLLILLFWSLVAVNSGEEEVSGADDGKHLSPNSRLLISSVSNDDFLTAMALKKFEMANNSGRIQS